MGTYQPAADTSFHMKEGVKIFGGFTNTATVISVDALDPESFIFPLLNIPLGENDTLKLFNAISSATAFTNKSLRKIGFLAEINKKISFHTARRSLVWHSRKECRSSTSPN